MATLISSITYPGSNEQYTFRAQKLPATQVGGADTPVYVTGEGMISAVTSISTALLPTIPVTDVKVNGNTVVSNKIAQVTVPTAVSSLTNDSGFITNNDLTQHSKLEDTATANKVLISQGSNSYAWEDAKFAGSVSKGGTANKTASIPFGSVDSTSTSTAFTATIDGITELRDGVCVYLKNGVVTSAADFTLNINNLGAKYVYTNLAAQTAETTKFNKNYTMLFVYNSTRISGGCWDIYNGYDSNTNTLAYQIRLNSSKYTTASNLYRYRLCFTTKNGDKLVPINNSTSTSATAAKAVNSTDSFNPFGPIYYYGSTTAITSRTTLVAASALWTQYTIDTGYSYYASGYSLITNDAVYIKALPLTDGTAKLISGANPFVQSLPTTEDGYIYIYLGKAYQADNAATTRTVEIADNKPVYYYKDGAIRIWGNPVDSQELPIADGPSSTSGIIVPGTTSSSISGFLACPVVSGVPYYKPGEAGETPNDGPVYFGIKNGSTITTAAVFTANADERADFDLIAGTGISLSVDSSSIKIDTALSTAVVATKASSGTTVVTGSSGTANVLTGVKANGTVTLQQTDGTADVLTGVAGDGTATCLTGVAANGTAACLTGVQGSGTATCLTGVAANGTATVLTGVAANGTATCLTGVTGTSVVTCFTHTFNTSTEKLVVNWIPTSVITSVGANGTANCLTGVKANGTANCLTGVKANGTANCLTGVQGSGTATCLTGVKANGTAVCLTGVKSNGTAKVVKSLATPATAAVLTGVAGNGTVAAVTGVNTTTITAVGGTTTAYVV